MVCPCGQPSGKLFTVVCLHEDCFSPSKARELFHLPSDFLHCTYVGQKKNLNFKISKNQKGILVKLIIHEILLLQSRLWHKTHRCKIQFNLANFLGHSPVSSHCRQVSQTPTRVPGHQSNHPKRCAPKPLSPLLSLSLLSRSQGSCLPWLRPG